MPWPSTPILLPGILSPRVAAQNRDGSLGGFRKPGEHSKQRGFAGAVAAEQSEASAAVEVERDVLQRGEVAVELPDTFDHDSGHSELGR